MSFHETIEAQQKANLLNQEFENKTGEGYQNALETKMGLYGDYKSEKTEIRDPFAEIDGSEGDSENPELMDDVEELMNEEEIEEQEKKHKELLNDKITNSENFKEDMLNLENIPELENIDFEIKNDHFEAEVLNKIGGNYLKNLDENQEYDVEKDFSLAIIETQKEILENVANIPVDTETYKVAIKNIQSGDLKTQLEGIESLYILAYNNEGKLAKTSLNKYKNKQKNKLTEKYKKTNIEIKELEIKENKNLEDQKKLEKLNIEKESIENQAIELEGDVFKSSEIDMNSEATEQKENI